MKFVISTEELRRSLEKITPRRGLANALMDCDAHSVGGVLTMNHVGDEIFAGFSSKGRGIGQFSCSHCGDTYQRQLTPQELEMINSSQGKFYDLESLKSGFKL